MLQTTYHVRASEAWQGLSVDEVRQGVNEALRARLIGDDDMGVWVREMYEDHVVADVGEEHYQFGFSVNADGEVEVAEEGTKVRQVWQDDGDERRATSEERAAEAVAGRQGGDGNDGGRRVRESYEVRALEQTDEPNEYRVEFLCHGLTANGNRYYPQHALETAAEAGIYDGKKMYINHERPGAGPPHRDLRDWVSTIVPGSVRAVEGNLQATVHAHHPDFMPILQDEVARAHVGLSVDQYVSEKPKRIDGRDVRAVEAISKCLSVDWVPEGNAYGRVLEAANMTDGGDDDMGLEDLTLEELQEARPDLVEAIQGDGEDSDADEEDTQTQEARTQEGRQALDEVTRLRNEVALRDQRDAVRDLVADTDLPAGARTRVVEACSSELIETENLQQRVQEAVETERGYLQGAMRDMGLGTQVNDGGTGASAPSEDQQRAQEAYEQAWERRAREQGFSQAEIKRMKEAVGR